MPARQLPAARAAASCGGRRGSDVHAHHRRSRGRPPVAALFPGGWAVLGSQGLRVLLGTQARSFTALAPAPCAPRPCAPSLGRGTSETQGGRALRPYGSPPLPRPIPRCSAPGSCAPLPPLHPVPPSALVGSAPPPARESVPEPGFYGSQDKEAWRGVGNGHLGTTSCSKVYRDQKFELGLRKNQALCVAALGDIWPEFAFQ